MLLLLWLQSISSYNSRMHFLLLVSPTVRYVDVLSLFYIILNLFYVDSENTIHFRVSVYY